MKKDILFCNMWIFYGGSNSGKGADNKTDVRVVSRIRCRKILRSSWTRSLVVERRPVKVKAKWYEGPDVSKTHFTGKRLSFLRWWWQKMRAKHYGSGWKYLYMTIFKWRNLAVMSRQHFRHSFTPFRYGESSVNTNFGWSNSGECLEFCVKNEKSRLDNAKFLELTWWYRK